jgi:hypothetical protein
LEDIDMRKLNTDKINHPGRKINFQSNGFYYSAATPPSKGGETIPILSSFATHSHKKIISCLSVISLKLIYFLSTFFLFNIYVYSQSTDYAKVFESDWEQALKYEKDNRPWIEKALKDNKIPYDYALAVVFPELVRYSALRDKMEITLLKALYINLGEQYANFSIGRFQIKPSFAEFIKTESSSVPKRKLQLRFAQPDDFSNITEYRKSIVTDLESDQKEFNYIIAFYKICERNFDLSGMDENMKIKFLATAYNYGPDKSQAEIERMIDKKFFNTKIIKTENFSYAEVALYWFSNYKRTLN